MVKVTAKSTHPKLADALLDVRAFGAKGDGQTDDTLAIQDALDAAGVVRGVVFFPPGVYSTSMLKVPSHTGLEAHPTWGYKDPGGTVLKLRDGGVPCLLHIGGSAAVRIVGLALEGGNLGVNVRGISLEGQPAKGENSLQIERTYVGQFTGTGAYLPGAWAYWIRSSLFFANRGDAVHVTGSDVFIYDSTFIGNGGYGIRQAGTGATIISGNRIEWNHLGGILIEKGHGFNIVGNQIDRSGGPGLHMRGTAPFPVGGGTITGNWFNRGGHLVPMDAPECCHVLLEHVRDVVFTANLFNVGKGDSGEGGLSPTYAFVYRDLCESIVKDNIMRKGAVKQSLLDLGNRDSNVLFRDNVGIKEPFLPPTETAAPQPPSTPPAPRGPDKPLALARRISAPSSVVDPTDAAWREVGDIGPFYLLTQTVAARQPTTVQVGCDRDNLYLRIVCWEARMDRLSCDCAPGSRDEPVHGDDSIDIFLLPPRRPEWHLIVNARGARWDARIEGGQEDVAADLDWRVSARCLSNRWIVQLVIPFAGLSETTPVGGEEWGFNVSRSEIPHGELSTWSPLSRFRFYSPQDFGRLRFAPPAKGDAI